MGDRENISSQTDRAAPLASEQAGPEAQSLLAPEDLKLMRDAWGALNFILAFYEPGQRYLDTNAWTQAEAGGRRAHAALRARLDAIADQQPRAPLNDGDRSRDDPNSNQEAQTDV